MRATSVKRLRAAVAAASASVLAGLSIGAAAAQTLSPKDVADQIIKAAHAEDLFQTVDAGEMPSARHLRSGLICLFFPGGQANGIQIGSKDALPRGDDVSCSTNRSGVNLDVFGARYTPSVKVDDQLERLRADLANTTLKEANVQLGPPSSGEHLMRSLSATGLVNGSPYAVFALVGQVNGWTFTLVCLEPGTDDQTCRSAVAAVARTELSSMSAAAAASAR